MAHAYVHKEITEKEDILDKVHRNFKNGIKAIYMAINLFVLTIGGAILHILDFEIVTTILGIIFPRLVIYVVGQYLTLLPTYILVILLFLPIGVSIPVVAISSFFSLFILFAI